MTADLHVHTLFSCDSKAAMRAYCEAALIKGIDTVCFTEHVDYNKNDIGYGFYNPAAFFEEYCNIKELYSGKLTLLCGIEFSEPHIYRKELEELSKLPYDFILGSLHYWIDDLFPSEMIKAAISAERNYEAYWREAYKAAECGGFDSFAHFDFPKRYYKTLQYDKSLISEIFKQMVKNDISLEINTSSLRKGLAETMPDAEMLSLYKKAGGFFVTFGSDAHKPEDLGADFVTVENLAVNAGLTLCVYKSRKRIIQSSLEIRLISYGSSEYKKELELRDDILRKPLGMSIYNDNISAENTDIHIGAFIGGELVGVMLLTRVDAEQMKMRQVAVAEKFQRKGIGSKMAAFAEEAVKKEGCRKIVLHSRKTAVEFYRKLGYITVGGEFLEVNIPHMEMYKDI